MFGFWAGNIQRAGIVNLGFLGLLFLSLYCLSSMAAQGSWASFVLAQGSKSPCPENLEREQGKPYCLFWSSLESQAMPLASHSILWKWSTNQPTVNEKVTRLLFLDRRKVKEFAALSQATTVGQEWHEEMYGCQEAMLGKWLGALVYPDGPSCHGFTFWFVGIWTVRHSQRVKTADHRPFQFWRQSQACLVLTDH